jgi:hypothetical protein
VPRVGRRKHFLTARIGTVSCEKLPIQTPGGLAELCSKYSGLVWVGLVSKSESGARGQVRYWWVLFRDQDTLEEIVLEFGGLVVDGMEVCIAVDRREKVGASYTRLTSSIKTEDKCAGITTAFE